MGREGDTLTNRDLLSWCEFITVLSIIYEFLSYTLKHTEYNLYAKEAYLWVVYSRLLQLYLGVAKAER